MNCRVDDCACLCHVSAATHVPACSRCRQPLHAHPLDEEYGDCPNALSRCPHQGRMLPAEEWLWLDRELFHGDDLPPYDGHVPIKLREDVST